MRKIISIALIALVAILFIYMLKQKGGNTVIKDKATETVETASSAIVGETKTPIVIDEQALALEEMKRNAGKSGLSKLYIVKCSSCHGRDGKGPIGPSIAGKDSAYNLAILLKYKNNQVPNTLMKGLLENTSEDDLRLLATEISSFK